MLESVLSQTKALIETLHSHTTNVETIFNLMIPDMESAILEAFIVEAMRAIDLIPEYSNPAARPLRDRFIQNISSMQGGRPVHVRILPTGSVFIFDEEFAGTSDDLDAVKHPSRNSQSLRYRFWKYGIYKRDVEGDFQKADQEWFNKVVDRLPSYEEIISERLSEWGNKAPYWYFIEYGNFGAGKAYPQFGGTFFISRFRQDAQQAVRFFREELARILTKSVTESANNSFASSRFIQPEHHNITFNKVLRNVSGTFSKIFKRK